MDSPGSTPISDYPGLPNALAEPYRNLVDLLGVYYGGEAPFDRVAPMFQSTYVYGYNWLPGELGKLPYYWPGQNPALGNVIWQWGVSGELLYLPQSSLFYSPFNIYPPPINPWGPGQLDDYSLQGIYAARTYQLFPALYKSGTSTMISPYVGTGNWDAFHGLGDRYTYMQFNEWGPVVAFYNSTGSNYGEDFATELGAYYGGLGYDFQFQLDQIQQRTDWILDRTVNPNGGSTSTAEALRREWRSFGQER